VYDVAVPVVVCLRSNTPVDLAWIVETDLDADLGEALGLTPGGGRLGTLLNGALDALIDRGGPARRLRLDLLPHGHATVIVSPADDLPVELWTRLVDRAPVALLTRLGDDGDRVVETVLADDDPEARELMARGQSARMLRDGEVLSVFAPTPRMVLLGRGPIIDAIEHACAVVGWKVHRSGEPSQLTLLAQSLTPSDSVVVLSHDLEAATAVLGAALDGRSGYIGALGSARMQDQRRQWLLEQGYDDLDRVHGPAGLAIGAAGPGEIAIAVLAEALAVHHGVAPQHNA
jgi:xanthine dehydrogenase accessory factor